MKYFRYLFALIIIFILAILAVMYMIASRPAPEPALAPEEHDALYESPDNGWHQIDAALNRIQVPTKEVHQELDSFSGDIQLSTEAIAFLHAQQDALALAKSGLEKDYSIPPRYNVNAPPNPSVQSQLRALARALVWEGHHLASKNEHAEAAQLQLDTLYLGHWNSNGGILVDALISVAIQRIGIRALQDTLPELDSTTLERIITELENLESITVPFKTVIATEKAIIGEISGSNFVTRTIGNYTNRPAFEQAEESYNLGRVRIIGTRLRAQVILHEKQTGEAPATLAEALAPDPVPIDPTTENPFRFDDEGRIVSDGTRPNDQDLVF